MRSIKISEDLYLNQGSTFLTYSSKEERNVATVLEAPRKQKEPSNEKEVLEDTDTEIEGSDEEQHKIRNWTVTIKVRKAHHWETNCQK